MASVSFHRGTRIGAVPKLRSLFASVKGEVSEAVLSGLLAMPAMP